MECTGGGRTRLGHEGLVGGTFQYVSAEYGSMIYLKDILTCCANCHRHVDFDQ